MYLRWLGYFGSWYRSSQCTTAFIRACLHIKSEKCICMVIISTQTVIIIIYRYGITLLRSVMVPYIKFVVPSVCAEPCMLYACSGMQCSFKLAFFCRAIASKGVLDLIWKVNLIGCNNERLLQQWLSAGQQITMPWSPFSWNGHHAVNIKTIPLKSNACSFCTQHGISCKLVR